jgi:hypothetical protein
MPRRNAEPAFCAEQIAHRYDPHIEPVNRLVDALSTDARWMPYVSPLYGGVNATILFLFQDPGPATEDGPGSGLLSPENDDPSAELFSNCLAEAGLSYADVITWNAYPWFIPSQVAPNASMLVEGVEPLAALIDVLGSLRAVCLCGRKAEQSWARYAKAHPGAASRLVAVDSLHPSRRGITRGGQQTREAGIAQLIESMRLAGTT